MKPDYPIIKTLLWLTLFSIAMGYLETAVVVYLRKLYFADGFRFPLSPVSPDIAVTEFWREACTIIMLLGAGIMAGRNGAQKFVFFLYCFAVWDIFYYVFLKVLLGWPESLFTWDVLFLIPVPWVGPVLAPCIVAVTMILFTLVTVRLQSQGRSGVTNWTERGLLLTGVAVILVSFMWDYFQFVANNPEAKGMWTLSSDQNLFSEARNYMPEHFNWLLFGCGEFILLGAITLFFMRQVKQPQTVRTAAGVRH
ncbi:MAG: hypothetical protein FD123_2312 [Bacteroidetes bacterium]|nr:MAG: hypothetical protein FD123_2312 [Bacteroidota bacterium]